LQCANGLHAGGFGWITPQKGRHRDKHAVTISWIHACQSWVVIDWSMRHGCGPVLGSNTTIITIR
jgi:hypothetical protein